MNFSRIVNIICRWCRIYRLLFLKNLKNHAKYILPLSSEHFDAEANLELKNLPTRPKFWSGGILVNLEFRSRNDPESLKLLIRNIYFIELGKNIWSSG